MVIAIPNYQIIKKIQDSSKFQVYQAQQEQDKKPVLLRVLKSQYPSLKELNHWKYEYEINRKLNLPGILKACRLEKHNNGLIFILENFNGKPLLDIIVAAKFNLTEFFKIAIKLTDIIGEIHQKNIIHKDIKPENIFINPKTLEIKLTGFSIASLLARESQEIRNPSDLEGTLAYMAPEQTGRINRAIDYRADYYALGVTFYQMLTQQLPFATEDPLELVHCHIAQHPLPPHWLDQTIPVIVSKIVLKLLAKNAEDRYQSSYGIKHDLEHCLNRLQQNNNIENFILGKSDRPSKFIIPQKLYGREQEIATLINNFNQVSKGETKLLLVSGNSGIGKSSLINEIHKPIVNKGGYFISGKFDEFKRNIPYQTLSQAFEILVAQILRESEARINEWKTKILLALGQNAQIVLDIIPKLELIIGKQPPLLKLQSTEAQNRFLYIFQMFLKVFTQAQQPLVIFLDDLQWIDAASLELIEHLITASDSHHLFLIGAYRNNEVDINHPLMLMLKRLQTTSLQVNQLSLNVLKLIDIKQIIADTLNCNKDDISSLAELVLWRTNGNPFFVNQFLKSLYQENLLTFQTETGSWKWDLVKIKQAGFTDNVVELIAGKIQKLANNTQHLLKLAACLGNKFDLNFLLALDKNLNLATDIWQAVREDLIFPVGNNYKFLLSENQNDFLSSDILVYQFIHDRVRQAAYSLIPEAERKIIHFNIGKLLLSTTNLELQELRVFDIVNQFNFCLDLITEPAEKNHIAELNLLAGKKAKDSIAYIPAQKYLKTGIQLLPANTWRVQYQLTFELYKELSECEYLCGNLETAEKLFEILLQNAQTNTERVEVYGLKIVLYTNLRKYSQAIALGKEGLNLLGWQVPRRLKLAIIGEFLKIKLGLANRAIAHGSRSACATIIDLPEITDANQLAKMKLIAQVSPALYYTDTELLTFFYLRVANLTLKYGLFATSSLAFLGLGRFLGEKLNDFQSRYELGKLALNLIEKFNYPTIECKVLFLYGGFINHWNSHAKSNIHYLRKSYQLGIESGNFTWACYANNVITMTMVVIETSLEQVNEAAQQSLAFAEQVGEMFTPSCFLSTRQFSRCLQGLTHNPLTYSDESFNEVKHLEVLKDNLSLRVALNWYYYLKLKSLYLLKDYSQAKAMALASESTIDFVSGLPHVANHYLYYSLVLTSLYNTANQQERKNYRKVLNKYQKLLKVWADKCSENFLHKYLLVAAEIARINNQKQTAIELYQQAITSAKENDYLQTEAIANELASEFFRFQNNDVVANAYLEEAYYCYQKWGATAKLKALKEQYPQLFFETQRIINPNLYLAQVNTTLLRNIENLDFNSVLKASQALSGEIILEQLLTKLMKIVIENAGAQLGFLILEQQGNWTIEAEGSVNFQDIRVLQSIPIDSLDVNHQIPLLSTAIVNYVIHTQQSVVLNDAVHEGEFSRDPYIIATQPKSVLCTPLLYQGICGVLYLENNLTVGAFTPERIEVLNILSSQAAISIKNAQLYTEMASLNTNLKQEISERHRAEDALRESEKKLAQFLEAVPVGVFVIDKQGKSYYANQTAQQILGKGIVSAATGAQLAETYQAYLAGTGQLYPNEQQPIIRALQGESVTIDNLEIHHGEQIIPLAVSATPIYDEHGEIVYAIAAFADISQRQRAEAERIHFTHELALKNAALQQAKDALANSNRTLEQNVQQRTQELSQTLEILKATQAKLIFENALLRSAEQTESFDYQVGGSLPMDAPTYVVRNADRHLYKALNQGDFCYILNARQMGKSSLMVRMIHHLQQEGYSCCAIDLTRIGSENITPYQWYKGLTVELWQSFDLLGKVNLKAWWSEHQALSPVQCLSHFIENILLPHVEGEKIFIFIDEIDSVLGLNFPINDFFALIRSCYNQRSINRAYQRLTFALFGVATPSDLITDYQRTPFNIGKSIQLEGFKEHEAQPLLQGLSDKFSNPQIVLKEVLAWTNGQPFLTQKICKLLRTALFSSNNDGWIENLIQTQIIEYWESQDEPEHLRTIRSRILHSTQSTRLLELYRQIWTQTQVVSVDSLAERELLLSGLVVKQQGFLQVHNQIYKLIFDLNWIELHL